MERKKTRRTHPLTTLTTDKLTMKTLYLIRHAKSSWDDPFQDDLDRPLNKRGKSDAPRMGKRLKEKDIHPDILISSPAERALSTCMIIAEKIGYAPVNIHTDEELYHASEDKLLSFVHHLNDANDEVMIFGHNPGLTDFGNRLCPEPVAENIPTCGIVALKFPVNSWKAVTWKKGALDFFDYPKSKLQ
ncbi:MAG: histidine phosphatase family protein [Cyclobacteriaceae bacterium]